MSICLGINDDIVLTFDRYEIFKKNQKPFPFVSVFLGEYSFCNVLNETVKSNKNLINDDFNSNFNENFVQNNNINQYQNHNQNNNQNHNQNQNQSNIKSDIKDINDIF